MYAGIFSHIVIWSLAADLIMAIFAGIVAVTTKRNKTIGIAYCGLLLLYGIFKFIFLDLITGE